MTAPHTTQHIPLTHTPHNTTGTSAPHDRVAAVIAGHCDVATLEAEIEADPAPLAIQDEHGETPLHLALNRGSAELVGTLVRKGAPVGAACALG